MTLMIASFKEEALATFKTGVLSGSDFLNSPKGEEFMTRLEKEQAVLTS